MLYDCGTSCGSSLLLMGRIMLNSAFEHVHNAQIHIILHVRKVSSGPLPSVHIFFSIQ